MDLLEVNLMGLINPDKLQQEFFVVKFLDREILNSVQKYVGIERFATHLKFLTRREGIGKSILL